MSGTGTILGLAGRSLWNRRATALLTIFSIAISITLLLGVERVPSEARASFANTISGNARRHFGPDFMISVPVVVAGNARAIQVPKNVKAYIIPLRWHKYEAALVVSLQGRGVV